jgi:3-hydroxyisobutyrate dehydrogenase-like beta-hydroxyacid dehydrogenase
VARRTEEGFRVAILGLGEAGGRIASDLVGLGVSVSGWDPAGPPDVDGLQIAGGPADAVHGADAVLSVNAPGAAVAAASASVDALAAGTLFADLNSAGPGVKAAVADVVGRAGALFADVALMAPVPARGLGTPCLASGLGAERFAELFRPLGTPVEVVGSRPGMAAERKLLRSVFMKGLAAAALESLQAGEAAGCEEWLRSEIESVLASADESLLNRLLEGSRRHAARRVDEMEAACELLRDLGVEPRIAAGAKATLADLEQWAHTP